MFALTSTNSELLKLSKQLNQKKIRIDTNKQNNEKANYRSFSDRLNENSIKLKSSYWKIDTSNLIDEFDSLTSMSIKNNNLLSIGSNSASENLKIYDLSSNENLLTHLTSITLPNIYSMKWLYNPTEDNKESDDEAEAVDFLLTGHDQGIVNLTMIPNVRSPSFQNAEIIKRYNHQRHISSDFDNTIKLSNNNKPTSLIYKIDTTPSSWRSCNKNSLLSIYKENIFMWDTSRSSYPILKNKIKGISSFDSNPKQDGLLALSGSFGLSLFDMRSASNTGLSSAFYIPNKLNVETSLVRWCQEDPNYLVSANINHELSIWDIRNLKPLSNLKGHSDQITSIQWEKFDILYSGSLDGNVIQWSFSNLDIRASKSDSPIKCTLRNGFDIDVTNNECGTLIPASNNQIIDLASVGENKEKILSLDKSFFGLHSKFTGEEKLQRQEQEKEIALEIPMKSNKRYGIMFNEVRRLSNETLFDNRIEEQPLFFSPPVTSVSRHSPFGSVREFSESSTTLVSSPISNNSCFSDDLAGTPKEPPAVDASQYCDNKSRKSFASKDHTKSRACRDFEDVSELNSILNQLKTTVINDEVYI